MPRQHDTDDWIFPGFANPNTTAVPDDFFDFVAPRLKEGALRVCLYMIRRTYGFKKESDDISITQMMGGITTKDGRVLDLGTGLSRQAVITAVKSLEAHRVIIRTANQSTEKGNEATTYRLNRLEVAVLDPQSTKLTRGGGQPSRLAPVNEVDPQQTVKQQTEISHSNIRKSNISIDDFVDNSTSQQISVEGPRPISRNGFDTDHGVEGVGSIMARTGPQREAVQPVRRQRGRPRKFQDQDSQIVLNYVADFAREFSDKATLNQSTTRMVNLYQRWGKGDIDAFVGVLYQARSVTKAQNNIRTSKFAYFCSVVEDLLGLKEEQNILSSSGT
jgi:hypothetical protein